MSEPGSSIAPAAMSSSRIAPEAHTGFAASSAYDAHRPSYPAEAVSQILSALSIADVEGATLADLAAGTGKFTELLAARPEKYKIIAIEPHDGMREQLEKKKLQGVTVVRGTAEDMSEIADESVDALVVAQAFHWFANKQALKEIHRVIKPRGGFGMIWNIENYNAPTSWEMTGWEAAVRDLTWTFDDNKPRYRHEQWRQIFDDQLKSNPLSINAADPLFSMPLGQGSVPFEIWLSKEDIWKRYRTISHIAVLEGEELERTRKTFDDALDAKDVQTDDWGRVAVHGHTVFAWTTRIPDAPLRSAG